MPASDPVTRCLKSTRFGFFANRCRVESYSRQGRFRVESQASNEYRSSQEDGFEHFLHGPEGHDLVEGQSLRTPHSERNDRYRPDSGPSEGHPFRTALRPEETFPRTPPNGSRGEGFWTPAVHGARPFEVKGFGRRPYMARDRSRMGRRPKASQGGNRGRKGRCLGRARSMGI
jgi:hypothetical protein